MDHHHEEESCSYLEMLKCGMGGGGGGATEEEILGFSSKFLNFGGMDDQPVIFPMMYQYSAGTGTGTGTGNGTGATPSATVQQMSSESSSMSTSLSSSSPTSTAATNSVLTNSSSSSRQQKKKQVNGGRKTEATGGGGTNKKAKIGGGVSQSGTIKVRKEKLGERIMALQQLVSPFGKSDTASVLLEALGYIRFLHEQVQEGGRSDLRSRGLCLVPVSCTEHVTSANGADLWSPPSVGNGIGNGNHPSFSTNH